MGFKTTVITSLLILLATGLLSAQPNKNGVPIVTNYPHSITRGSEQNWCITQDHRGVIYVGNQNKGVLEYDGVEWRRISVPRDPMISSMATGDDGVVYVGSVSEFGFLAPDRSGSLGYKSLSDGIDQGIYPFDVIWKTYCWKGKVYFCSQNLIFIYNPEDDSLDQIETPENTFFSFLIEGKLFLSAWEIGLMKYENNQFVLVPGGEFFAEKSVTGLVRFDESRMLVGTRNMGLYLFNTIEGKVEDKFLDQEMNDFFRNGIITNIQPLEENFVVSSLNNGVVFLSRDGTASEILTKKEDLIDDYATYAF